jgi:hypothetical protein
MARVDVDATIPPEWMTPDALYDVIAFIRRLRIFPSSKRELLARWALIVGADVPTDQYTYVMGIDRR